MPILQSRFLISNSDVSQCPALNAPEYAFIGRSNVGKSSLINMLCHHKDLAKTSQKPGKTLLINHFEINNGKWYLVDLPGYGYAQAGKKQREQLRKMIERYCLMRENLYSLFVLVDSRHKPQNIDLEFISWLGEQQIPFSIVFTKIDKLSKQQLQDNLEVYKQQLSEQWEELPPLFLTSSEKNIGAEEIIQYIESIS
ncbi:MAG: YihA family ribosome biogenesis GTP-binding protein [Paludibacteraceae bacterium]|nr:YihA family ribosome biogenesis GTP-binding protein [Paludibacteraceae bacterium]MBR1787113.1 YihA family ribosome biogenesis GTP-binding protein [Paludibacteraceae bacterium]